MACILFLSVVILLAPEPPTVPSPTPPHEPITIDGDAQFTAENGVARGNGTADNPYVIENLEISAANGAGMAISNTRAHLVISNVSIRWGLRSRNFTHAGMLLYNVRHVVVANSSIAENVLGIWARDSSDVAVLDSNISSNRGTDFLAESHPIYHYTFERCAGVCLEHSTRVRLDSNEFYGDGGSAVYANDLTDSVILGNEMEFRTGYEIILWQSENLTIGNNTLETQYGGGVSINHCQGVMIRDNAIVVRSVYGQGHPGLSLVSSVNITAERNSFASTGISVEGDSPAEYGSLEISSDNLVNGHPIAFHKDCSGLDLTGSSWGQVMVANCTDVRIHDLEVFNTAVGVQLAHSSNVTVSRATIAGSGVIAVLVRHSANVTVEDSLVDTGTYGIQVEADSRDVKIHDNVIKNQVGGIAFLGATKFEIIGNTIVDGLWEGLGIVDASDFRVSSNEISRNRFLGIFVFSGEDFLFDANHIAENANGTLIYDSSRGIFSQNIFESDGLHISGSLEDFESLTISANNTVNGLPVTFLKDCRDREIDGEALGQLIIANCTDVSVSHLTIADANAGVSIAYSENVSVAWSQITSSVESLRIRSHVGVDVVGARNVSIANNVISGSLDGISIVDSFGIEASSNTLSENLVGLYSYESGHMTIERNTFVRNFEEGLNLVSVSNSSITENQIAENEVGLRFYHGVATEVYHNNFIGNSYQALAYECNCSWDQGFESGGNYWSDYVGEDTMSGPNQTLKGADGIGDTPYEFPWDGMDRYPLMASYGSQPVVFPSIWPLILLFAGFACCFLLLVLWQRRRNVSASRSDDRPS